MPVRRSASTGQQCNKHVMAPGLEFYNREKNYQSNEQVMQPIEEKSIKFYNDMQCNDVYLCKVLNSNMFYVLK
jgi:hypothetical protein